MPPLNKEPEKPKLSAGQPRYMYYTDLNYMPSSMKNELWMAQQIIFAKRNARPLVSDMAKLNRYRGYDELKVNESEYKKLFDPVTPLGKGGEARYVAADWKACPIYIHLCNIVKAGIEKIPLYPEVDVVDKVTIDEKQKANSRIIYQREFRNLINKYNVQLGLPPLKGAQDPYKYIKSIGAGENGETVIDSTVSIIDLIRSQIEDEQDLAMFNEYIYKGDIEIAFELGIKHYLLKQNKWDIVSEMLLDDLKNINTYSFRFYTDRITGRPVVKYFDPADIYTSSFERKDGEDITYWFHEYNISFAEFVRQLGGALTEAQLMDVFEMNKTKGGCHSLEWRNTSKRRRDSAGIRVGFISVLTQNYDTFSEANVKGNYQFKSRSFSWEPSPNTIKKYQAVKQQKHYNVWYSAYYLPPTLESQTSGDFNWQAQYVFDLQRNQDQYRYGNDERYAKSELVVWKSTAASFMDVVDSFMPKITHLWHRMQNDMVQAIPGGKLMAQEMLGMMTNAVDGTNKEGGQQDELESARNMWGMIKQTGWGWVKFLDGQGNLLPLDKLSVDINSTHLKNAMEDLTMMLGLYDLLTKSLAMNSIREGDAPKPRVSLGGIQMSMEASNNGTWFIEKPFIKAVEMGAERCVQYINTIAKETKLYNYWDRFNELKRVVGAANGYNLETIADIPLENIGLSVKNNSESHAQRMDYLIGMATELVKSQQLDADVLNIIVQMDNYKYASVLMIMNHKKKKREIMQMQNAGHQQAMQLKQVDLQIAQTLQAQKIQGTLQNTDLQGQWDMRIEQLLTQLKTQSQSLLKEQTKNNRIEQDNNKARVDAEAKAADAIRA